MSAGSPREITFKVTNCGDDVSCGRRTPSRRVAGRETKSEATRLSSEVGAETNTEPGVSLGELAARAGVSALELVGALIEARLVTVDAYAEAHRPAPGEPGLLRVTVSAAELLAWLDRWALERAAVREPGE